MLRIAAALVLTLAFVGCKQDCSMVCQQQLGCAATANPDASAQVGPRCDQLCASGDYRPSDACITCLDSHGLCSPTADGGYVYEGCEDVCPVVP